MRYDCIFNLMVLVRSIILATRVVVLLELPRQSKIASQALATSVTSKSLRTPFLPISACKPPPFLAQMNLRVALSKKAQTFYIWV